MKLNNILKLGLIFGIPAISMVSCTSSGNRTGIEYAPQMYVSDAYEPFSQEEDRVTYNPNNMTMRLPVNGTVARGQLAFNYGFENNAQGYTASATNMPTIAATKANVEDGKALYDINCWHCHGKKGKNDGPIFKGKKMPAPAWPGYTSDYIQNLPEGKIYHVITYGKGLMGPHAFLLSPEERWKVTHYVKSLAKGDAFEYAPDSDQDGHNSHSDEDVISLEGIGLHSFPGTDEEKQMILAAIAKVEFKGVPNRKEIKSSSFSSLGQIANYLTSNPTYKAKIEGHTGYTATEEGAEALAMDRAKNVIAYLADKGVDGHNLTPIGVVDHDDNGDITSSADRKANRRVDIVIYK